MRQYLLVTANYWAFTLTDGALRMLVLLHFHQLGYSPLQIAMLFLFYEFFGVVTNLVGGWLGARIGLNRTMNIGLGLQLLALLMLALPNTWLSVAWVMAAQALSGIAKDLNKMSAKSAVKLFAGNAENQLFRWVAVLTGSKNTLKGCGFFMGALLLQLAGFNGAIWLMFTGLMLVWLGSLLLLQQDLGKAKNKPKFREVFSKSRAINQLSAARLCLFAARDVWFVVALPIYLHQSFGWDFWQVGGFLALWIIAYGAVQSLSPWLLGSRSKTDGSAATLWAAVLSLVPLLIAIGLDWQPQLILLGGLALFGLVFAINSALHSYLIVDYASVEGVSMDVGFYYMANAGGRLLGTVLSGVVFQYWGLAACLLISAGLLMLTTMLSIALPRQT
ncbi:organoarsenical effux MFS transporter ArsJ [Pontibacter sp. JAM-7]|uniref:organoarsenical effux MFS transporter ArsJ n=1 Tax=Pontibacter sp. JAM-7 TaxID=3366581 RepID=UPI003AF57F5D